MTFLRHIGLHRFRYKESLIGQGGMYVVRCSRCGAERETGA